MNDSRKPTLDPRCQQHNHSRWVPMKGRIDVTGVAPPILKATGDPAPVYAGLKTESEGHGVQVCLVMTWIEESTLRTG